MILPPGLRATLSIVARTTVLAFVLLVGVIPGPGPWAAPATSPHVIWHPARPVVGSLAWIYVPGVRDRAVVEGSVAGRPLVFFPHGGGRGSCRGPGSARGCGR